KKLAEHREAAFFSRKLVTVQDDLELAFGWEQLTVRPPDAEKLQALGERYELRRLLTWAEQVRSGSLAMAGAGGAMAGPGVPLAPDNPCTFSCALVPPVPAGSAPS